jgi:hypothetical protein
VDVERFDTLARIVGSRVSRRVAVGVVATGLLGVTGPDEVEARCSRRKPCGPCKRCRKGRCKQVRCGGQICRCPNGNPCADRNDCQSAYCADLGGAFACSACSRSTQCGSDVNGSCVCRVNGRCATALTDTFAPSCAGCPSGWICGDEVTPRGIPCHAPCGSSGVCGVPDDCKSAHAGGCGDGGQCFQPLGRGPTRCGASVTNTCGCISHRQCATDHGAGAFCVQITGPRCTCGAFSTFCAVQR